MLLFDSVGHYFRLRREMLSESRFTVLLLSFLDNREKNMPSFLPLRRAYRDSNARRPCSKHDSMVYKWYSVLVRHSSRESSIDLIYKLHGHLLHEVYTKCRLFLPFFQEISRFDAVYTMQAYFQKALRQIYMILLTTI